jgi:hypothetical protein
MIEYIATTADQLRRMSAHDKCSRAAVNSQLA